MKKIAVLLVVAGAMLVVPVLSASAHSYRHDYDYDRDYRWSYGYQYHPQYYQVVTTPYWCGTYYSSEPCTYAYPQYQYMYQPYMNYNYNQYHYQPHTWSW